MTPKEALNTLDETVIGNLKLKIVLSKALEKQIPKNPIKKNPICYEKTKDGTELIAYDYFCPDCNKQIKAIEHHCECGQALDWSDTE